MCTCDTSVTSNRMQASQCAGIVLRYAERDLKVPASPQPFAVHRGTLVAVCPYLIHHEARFYARPNEYDPARHMRTAATGRSDSGAGEAPAAAAQQCPFEHAGGARAHGGPWQAAVSKAFYEAGSASASTRPAQDPNPVNIAFGAGAFRCPGRGFATCQLRLAVATLFTLYPSLQLGGDSDSIGKQVDSSGGRSRATNMGEHVPQWLRAHVVPGEHVAARVVTSGDKRGRLPRWQPQLLVGVKKPTGALMVQHV
jgi:hypothetical protein